MKLSILLAAEWESFRHACFPPDLSKQQMIDLRRTFFGGAAGLLSAMSSASLEEVGTEDLLSAVQTELLTFNEDVKAGRA